MAALRLSTSRFASLVNRLHRVVFLGSLILRVTLRGDAPRSLIEQGEEEAEWTGWLQPVH